MTGSEIECDDRGDRFLGADEFYARSVMNGCPFEFELGWVMGGRVESAGCYRHHGEISRTQRAPPDSSGRSPHKSFVEHCRVAY